MRIARATIPTHWLYRSSRLCPRACCRGATLWVRSRSGFRRAVGTADGKPVATQRPAQGRTSDACGRSWCCRCWKPVWQAQVPQCPAQSCIVINPPALPLLAGMLSESCQVDAVSRIFHRQAQQLTAADSRRDTCNKALGLVHTAHTNMAVHTPSAFAKLRPPPITGLALSGVTRYCARRWPLRRCGAARSH